MVLQVVLVAVLAHKILLVVLETLLPLPQVKAITAAVQALIVVVAEVVHQLRVLMVLAQIQVELVVMEAMVLRQQYLAHL
jgi:hypothetical protein